MKNRHNLTLLLTAFLICTLIFLVVKYGHLIKADTTGGCTPISFSWYLDFQAKSVDTGTVLPLGENCTQNADNPQPNLLIQAYHQSTGAIIAQKKTYVNMWTYYDGTDNQGKINTGGVMPESDMTLRDTLNWPAQQGLTDVAFRFIKLPDNTLLAGDPGTTPTPTPHVTPTPTFAPQFVTATASSLTIIRGQNASLSWTTNYANSVSIDNGIGTVPVNGSKLITPSQTTTYTLTATGAGGTTSVRVTVTVNEPSYTVNTPKLTATSDATNQVTLNWSETSLSPYGIVLYTSSTGVGDYSYDKTFTGVTSYVDQTDIADTTTHYYEILAYVDHNGIRYYSSPAFAKVRLTGATPLAARLDLKAKSQANKVIKLTWLGNITGDNDGYEIWRSDNGGANFAELTDAPANISSYTDKSQKTKGTIYTYKIRAYKLINTQRNYSPFTNTDSAKATP